MSKIFLNAVKEIDLFRRGWGIVGFDGTGTNLAILIQDNQIGKCDFLSYDSRQYI